MANDGSISEKLKPIFAIVRATDPGRYLSSGAKNLWKLAELKRDGEKERKSSQADKSVGVCTAHNAFIEWRVFRWRICRLTALLFQISESVIPPFFPLACVCVCSRNDRSNARGGMSCVLPLNFTLYFFGLLVYVPVDG